MGQFVGWSAGMLCGAVYGAGMVKLFSMPRPTGQAFTVIGNSVCLSVSACDQL